MKEEMSFKICGKEFVLPATPDPVEFSWENEVMGANRSPKGSVKPNRKRFRLVKKKKTN